MKKSRIAILLVFALLFSVVLSSCGDKTTEITVTLKFMVGETTVTNVPVKMNKANPTVIEVVREAMVQYAEVLGEMIVLADDGIEIQNVKADADTEYPRITDSSSVSVWEFYLNDEKEPPVGLANSVTVSDGDTIRYSYYVSQ